MNHYNPSKSSFIDVNLTRYNQLYDSAFLGIFEGKRKARIEEEKRKTLAAQVEAKKAGYDPQKEAADQAIKLEETKQDGEKILYAVVGFIVVAVMGGLLFIKRK